MSLLHDVLRPPQAELEALGLNTPHHSSAKHEILVNGERAPVAPAKPPAKSPRPGSPESAEGSTSSSSDEEVGVVSLPPTPTRGSRAGSPTRLGGASSRPAPGPLIIGSSQTDPLRRLTTELGIKVFSLLPIESLVQCSMVCKKWRRSQTLNFVWFVRCRMDQFQDSTHASPARTSWTRRESRDDWRKAYGAMVLSRRDELPPSLPPLSRSSSRPHTPSSAGYQTPREHKEEQWAKEAEAKDKPSKVEMREVYKKLGGRKVKSKGVWDKGGGSKDRSGWNEEGGEW